MTLDLWLALGFAAQALFASRFLVPSLAREKQGRSVMPPSFWSPSFGG